MAGGLLQIVAYGFQDIYLTNDPQITFFKTIYRRYTNFSIESHEKTFNDNPDFGKMGKVKLYRLGDLATKMYLRIIINEVNLHKEEKFAWIRRLGHAMIRRIEIEIGGIVIDRHYGTWLDVWYELARTGKHDRGYDKMIGDVDVLTEYNKKDKPEYVLYIPLQFWFNRHYGTALPLIAIQYHDIYIRVEFEEKEKLIIKNKQFNNYDNIKILEVGLVTDYIYLDIDERRRFAYFAHEYLIEQVQTDYDVSIGEDIRRLRLTFNFPTKEIIWAPRNGNYISGKRFLCYTNKDDWSDEIIKCSRRIMEHSMTLSKHKPNNSGSWEEFKPGVKNVLSSNGNYQVTNKNKEYSLWINLTSLVIKDCNITGKIEAIIKIDKNSKIIIKNITSEISEEDISIPVEEMRDTRLTDESDVYVRQFSNYGLLITGQRNPLNSAKLEYNDYNRFDKRNGKFFGVLQPYLYHSNTPKDGINLYSFALEPEQYQPTGTSNLSKIENVILTLYFDDHRPYFDTSNLDNRLFIFAFSYNIFRVISGLTGLSYTS
jgi:hypothetical protein